MSGTKNPIVSVTSIFREETRAICFVIVVIFILSVRDRAGRYVCVERWEESWGEIQFFNPLSVHQAGDQAAVKRISHLGT